MTGKLELFERGSYQIRVKGSLNAGWAGWFGDFTVVPQPNDETVLTGEVTDQAALYGLLAKIRDLGLPLLSLQRIESKPG